MLMLLFILGTGRVWAQSIGTFTDAGHMAASRKSHTATLLPDGRVLIAGGYSGVPVERAIRSAELYDPSTGAFAATGDLTTPRVYHTATLLPNGRVLITGGQSDQPPYQSVGSAELYDLSTGKFTAAGTMVAARVHHSAVLLSSGKVLITSGAAGLASKGAVDLRAELYDPASGTFAATGTPVSIYPCQVDDCWMSPTATLLQDGRVLVTWTGTDAELYDPRAGTFSPTGSMMAGRWYEGGTQTLLANGTVLVAGGSNEGAIDSAEVYDPSTGTFRLTGKMTTRRARHTATLLRDGTVLIAGANQAGWEALVSTELYDPDTGTFSARESLATPRYLHTGTLLDNGTVLIAGGYFGVRSTTTSAELYTAAGLAAPVPVFPLDGIVTENLRPRLQVHNVAVAGTVGTVTYRFQWSDRSDFQVGRRTGFKDNVPEGGGGDTAHEIPEELAPNTLHYWRARATRTQLVGKTDFTVTSEYSQVRSFRTPNIGFISENKVSLLLAASGSTAAANNAAANAPTTDPGVAARPLGVVATASGSGVVLTWIGPSGMTPLRYAISGGDAPHLSTLPVVVTPDASTRYTIPALPPGHYYFTVSAILAGGLSSPSDQAEVVATGSTSATGPPSGALAVSDGRTFTVTWTRGQEGATVYYVEIGSAPGREDVATLTTTQPGITFRADAATYYLRVRAAGGATVSQPSNEVSVSVAPSICTATPLDPVLLPVSTTSGETTISWLPAGGPRADHYRVDGTGPSGPTTMSSLGTGTSLTASLKPGVYAIRVTAINACGGGAASNQITFTQPKLATSSAR